MRSIHDSERSWSEARNGFLRHCATVGQLPSNSNVHSCEHARGLFKLASLPRHIHALTVKPRWSGKGRECSRSRETGLDYTISYTVPLKNLTGLHISVHEGRYEKRDRAVVKYLNRRPSGVGGFLNMDAALGVYRRSCLLRPGRPRHNGIRVPIVGCVIVLRLPCRIVRRKVNSCAYEILESVRFAFNSL